MEQFNDSNANSGGPNTGNNKLDSYKLALSHDDFKKIDKDQDEALSQTELGNAAKEDGWSQASREAINGLHEDLVNGPRLAIRVGNSEPVPVEGIIPSWFDKQFAIDHLSREDLNAIDTSNDGVLSAGEFSEAKRNDKLTPMSKHAADILQKELADGLDDPIYTTNGGIRNWFRANDEAEAAIAKINMKDVSTGAPGVKFESLSDRLLASKLDAQGRPLVLQDGFETFNLKYDDQGRITEMTIKDCDDKRTISYDDADQSQTVTLSQGDNVLNKTKLTFKDGKPVKLEEEADERKVTMHADGMGNIVERVTENPDKTKEVSHASYDENGLHTSTKSSILGADGKVIQETSFSMDKDGMGISDGVTRQFDDKGRLVREFRMSNDGKRGHALEKSLDENGKPVGALEMNTDGMDRILSLTEKNSDGQVNFSASVSYGKGWLSNPVQIDVTANGAKVGLRADNPETKDAFENMKKTLDKCHSPERLQMPGIRNEQKLEKLNLNGSAV